MSKSHKRALTIGIRNESTTTKAAWFWQALHTEYEFSAAYFKAILEDDDDAITEALDIIGMSLDEVELSEEEYTSFSRGFTPSGELEVTSWEGYYVTDPLPSGQVFALLIYSFHNRVYWGPVDGFIEECWSDCQIEYHLGSDPTTLCFSSPNGDVTLSFSRDYNEETGDIGNSSVKGTVGDIAISAIKTVPPLPASVKASLLNNDGGPEDSNHFLSMTGKLTLTVRQLLALRRVVREEAAYCLGIGKSYLERRKVDLTIANKTLATRVMQKLNEKLDGVDYNKETIERAIERLKLKAYTSTQLGDSVETHIRDTIAHDGRVIQDDLPPPIDREVGASIPGWIRRIAKERTELVMFNFGADSPGIHALLMSTMYENHKEFYRSRVAGLEQELEVIEKFIDRASRDIQRWRGEVKDRQKEADRLEKEGKRAEADVERKRIADLQEKVKKERSEVERKELDRTDKEDHKREAEKKRDIHDEDIKKHERDWERHVKERMKKRLFSVSADLQK